jgi:hypothetical protein
MSKMSELSQVLDELVSCGEKMIQVANAIRECFSEEAPQSEPVKEEETKTPSYTKEEVRGLLADKAAEAGGQYKAQVKALVKKYSNGGSLTDIPADSYPALVKEMEGMTDA